MVCHGRFAPLNDEICCTSASARHPDVIALDVGLHVKYGAKLMRSLQHVLGIANWGGFRGRLSVIVGWLDSPGEEICYGNQPFTRTRHFACYFYAGLEDDSTIASLNGERLHIQLRKLRVSKLPVRYSLTVRAQGFLTEVLVGTP